MIDETNKPKNASFADYAVEYEYQDEIIFCDEREDAVAARRSGPTKAGYVAVYDDRVKGGYYFRKIG